MQPREKFTKYGPTKLESRELVATILGSGTKGANVFNISKKAHKMIQTKGVDISTKDLQKIRGIGPLKATQIVSSFELAKRYFIQDDTYVTCTQDILPLLKEIKNKKQEHLLCITLDGAYRVINTHTITIGLLNQSLVHPREVFAPAIEERAHSIILAHNHPGGTCEASIEDKRITRRIKEVGDLVGIHLLDHIIVTKNSHWSFKEKGYM